VNGVHTKAVEYFSHLCTTSPYFIRYEWKDWLWSGRLIYITLSMKFSHSPWSAYAPALSIYISYRVNVLYRIYRIHTSVKLCNTYHLQYLPPRLWRKLTSMVVKEASTYLYGCEGNWYLPLWLWRKLVLTSMVVKEAGTYLYGCEGSQHLPLWLWRKLVLTSMVVKETYSLL